MIEWYDFLLYGTVSALIFGKLYFPHSSPIVGVLEAFSVFFIGFVGRPIGAAIFGHWGDRIGRKATLIATLLVTGISTVAVGLVPTYASIGIWGAVLLTVIRLIQGIGVGGEWGGSVLLAMEWARTTKNRGFLTSWPQFGAPAGFFLANLAVLFFSWLSGDQFVTWGWRIPFFLSIVMVGIGLWIQLGILETPVFEKVLAEERVERVPVLEVLKRQPKQVVLSALLRMPEQAPGYIVGAFIFTYGTTVLGVSRDFLLVAVLVQCCGKPDGGQDNQPDHQNYQERVDLVGNAVETTHQRFRWPIISSRRLLHIGFNLLRPRLAPLTSGVILAARPPAAHGRWR